MHGSGTLVRWLLDNRLVDEITLLTHPVVVGPDTALELVESQVTAGGVIVQEYRPAGRPEYAT